MCEYLDWFCAAIGACVGYLFGGVDGLIHALLTLTILDYITGIAAAWVKKELSSNTGFTGIARKIGIFALVGVAHIVDKELLGDTRALRDAVLFFYLANEALSILENAHKLKIPLPDVLVKHLLQIRGEKGS